MQPAQSPFLEQLAGGPLIPGSVLGPLRGITRKMKILIMRRRMVLIVLIMVASPRLETSSWW